MIRSSSVTWKGTGKEGEGKLSTGGRHILSLPFDFHSRFSQPSNRITPEELIAAAHAADFVMKLSFILDEAGFPALVLKATANISFVNGSLASSHLVLAADILGITPDMFQACVKEAELTCPITRALDIPVSSEATLGNDPDDNHD